MNRKRFCDECGIEGYLIRNNTDNSYTCINCGKDFTNEEFKKLELI